MTEERCVRAAILAAALVLFLPGFFTRGLWSPDEPRYAAVSWQMRTSRDFLVPRINEGLYPEKPPLFFYLAAAADLIIPPDGGRLVEAAAMVAIAAILAQILRRGEARLYAALVFFSSLLSLEAGKFGVIDALLVACMVAGIACGRSALERERPVVAWVYCYAALAAGCLVKGPVILIFALLALAGSLGGLAVPASRWRHAAGHLLGLLVFAAIIAAWLIPACQEGGAEYTEALLGQILGRISGEREAHIRPWHYYLVAYTFCFFPWTILLAAAIGWAASRLSRLREHLWLLLWFAAGFLLLSLFASKRERYLFLILPAAAMLLARFLAQAEFTRLDRAAMRLTAGVLIAASWALFASGIAASFILRAAPERLPPDALEFLRNLRPWQVWTLCPALGLVAFGGSYAAWRSVEARVRPRPFVVGILSCVAAASLAFDLVVAPALDPIKTGSEFLAKVKAYADRGGALYLYGKHYDGRFNLHLERLKIPVIGDGEVDGDVQLLLERKEPVAVVVGWRGDASRALPPPFHAAARLASGKLGGRKMLLVGNQAAEALYREW